MTLSTPACDAFHLVVSEHFANLNKLIIFFFLTVSRGWKLLSNTACLKGLGPCSIGFDQAADILSCTGICGRTHFLHASTRTSQILALQRNEDAVGTHVFEMPGRAEQGRGL